MYVSYVENITVAVNWPSTMTATQKCAVVVTGSDYTARSRALFQSVDGSGRLNPDNGSLLPQIKHCASPA